MLATEVWVPGVPVATGLSLLLGSPPTEQGHVRVHADRVCAQTWERFCVQPPVSAQAGLELT